MTSTRTSSSVRPHRARRWAHAVLAGAFVGALVAAQPSSAAEPVNAPAPPTSCAPATPLLPGDNGKVSGMDPRGRYMTISSGVLGPLTSYFWDNGRLEKINLDPEWRPYFRDVNSRGLAVGWTAPAEKPRTPWLAVSGAVRQLPGEEHLPTAINDSNVIAGTRYEERTFRPVPVVWDRPTSQPRDLPLPDGATGGFASDIDEDGTIVGSVTGTENPGVLWTARREIKRLATPMLNGVAPTSWGANNIRYGWISGWALAPGASLATAVRWRTDTAEREAEALYAYNGHANANRHGWLAANRLDGTERAFLHTPDRDISLPEIAGAPADAPTRPELITDDGRILAGYAYDSEHRQRAVMWRCR